MKNLKRYISMNGKEVIITMIISIIVFVITLLININNWIPTFGGNRAIEGICIIIVALLLIASALCTMTTLEIFVIGLITQAVSDRKFKKSSSIVKTTLTEEYTPVKLNDADALRHVLNDMVDVADVISEAKMSNDKVALKMHIDIETEMFVDQFTDNFDISN